jgi:molybdenum cofactor cytidylyltransferase
MWFGVRNLDDLPSLVGATLAHSMRTPTGKRFKKGRVLNRDDLESLRLGGVGEITVASPSDNDVSEDDAARMVADAIGAEWIARHDVGTGRVNFHAEKDGVFVVDTECVHAGNRVDPAITVATLPNHSVVRAGQMVTTVKIIPFFVNRGLAKETAARLGGADTFRLHPFVEGSRVAMVQTRVSGTKETVLDKTRDVTDARIRSLHAQRTQELRTGHTVYDVACAIEELLAGNDMILVFGASAVTDRRDVVPQAIEQAGGSIIHVGMPVDPGNLLVLGEVSGKPVIGAPGCARSPKENGFDWVLQRLSAGLSVTPDDIVSMGVGGLLMEIPVRPHPREKAATYGRSDT